MADKSKKKPVELQPLEDIASIIEQESNNHDQGGIIEEQEENFWKDKAKQALSDEEIKAAVLKNKLVEKEIEVLDKHIYNLGQNITERKSYAQKIFLFTVIWALLIFLVIFSIATGKFLVFLPKKFILSDKVIITLITSTTINFFGFFLLVVKYLFNPEEKINKKKKKIKKTDKKSV